jgi:hypothetical protein
MPADVIIDPSTGQIYWNDGTGSPQSISIKGDALNAISVTGYSASFSPGSSVGGTTTLVTFNDNSGTDALVPGTTGFNLGSATLRWNTFSSNANLSGTLLVADSTISSSLLSGSARFNGGIAISGNASIGQSLLLYGAGTAYTYYTGFKAGSTLANTLYTLPVTYPSTGTSVLQSDTSGIMTWVPMTASSSSGGTVYSGTLGQLAFYGATGNTVGGATGVTYNPTTGVLYNSHTTASISSTTGAEVVLGGVGIGASLIVGGRVGIGTNLLTSIFNVSGSANILGATVITAPDISSKALQVLGFSSSTQGDIFSIEHPAGGSFVMSGNLAGQAGGRFTIIASGNSQVRPYTFVINASDNKTVLTVDATSSNGILSLNNGTTLRIYNSTGAQYSGFAFTGANNVLYSLPNNDGSSGQFLQTNGSGGLTWATATGGAGSGSTGVNPGAQYQIGYYASTGSSIDGSNTFSNNTATGVVSITHGTASIDPTSGALKVSGGVGIGGSLFVGGIGASISGVRISNGAITGGAWNGTVIATQYGGTGQNLSSSSGILTISSGTVSASTTSSAIANALSDETGSGALVFATGPALVTPDIGAATGTSLYLSATTASTAATNGALKVPGGVGIGGSVSIGGYLQLFNGGNYSSFVSSATANTVYTLPPTSPSTGSSVLQSTSTGIMSWVPMVASSSSGTVNSGTAGSVAVYTANGTVVSGTNLITYAGSGVTIGGAINATSTSAASLVVLGGLGITANAFIGGTTTIQSTQVSTSIASGALVVAGGVGIGGSLYTNNSVASSVSGVALNNGFVTSGTWAGTVITALYGGTGFNSYSVGDLLIASTGNSLAKISASSNTGYVLTSNGSNTLPTWQAVPPAAATSVAVTGTTLNQSFFITTVSASSGSGLGLSTIQSFVVNPSTGIVSVSGLAVTAATQSTNATSGAFIVSYGAAVGQTLSVGGSLNIFSATSNYSGFRYSGTANTTYLLPPNSPQSSVGTSVLASTIDGTMRWVGMSAGGSATPGGNNKQIQYNSSSTFAGASGFEYTTGGIAVTVSVFAPSGTGYTSGLWINAIDGATTRVGIGLSNPAYELEILGEISATNKSFVIDHPTKSGMKLRYGSLEGPENGVYVRGELENSNLIVVPDHWIGLVHEDSYTVHLTPIGRFSQLYVSKIENYNVYIADSNMNPIHCYYSVWAERKDIPKLITEY